MGACLDLNTVHAWLDDSDDHLRWLAPTDLNLVIWVYGYYPFRLCNTGVLGDSDDNPSRFRRLHA